MSKAETVVLAFKAVLATLPFTTVERADGWPERMPLGRLALIFEDRDTDPEEQLGTEGPWYVEHPLKLGLAVQAGTEDARLAAMDSLLDDIDAALSADLTMGGIVFGMTYSRPAIAADAFPGAAGVRSAEMDVTIEYQSPTRT